MALNICPPHDVAKGKEFFQDITHDFADWPTTCARAAHLRLRKTTGNPQASRRTLRTSSTTPALSLSCASVARTILLRN